MYLLEKYIFIDGDKGEYKIKVSGNRIERINNNGKWREPEEFQEETRGKEDWHRSEGVSEGKRKMAR